MMVAVRPFALADRASLGEAIDAVCAEGHWMSTPRFEPTPAWDHALQEPACPDHCLLVAEDGGQVMGWCRLFPQARCSDSGSVAEVGIGLRAEYRGQGLGRDLLEQALDWATGRGLAAATLTTRSNNVRAVRLFEGCGFIRIGLGTDGWLEMACQLLPLV